MERSPHRMPGMMLGSAIKYGLLTWIFIIAIGLLVYWGNGNHLNTVLPPQVTVIQEHTKEIEDLKRQVTDRDHLIQHLKAQVKSRNFVIKEYENRLLALKQEVKPQPVIVAEIKQVSMQKGGLERENRRILGDILDVSRVRIAQ